MAIFLRKMFFGQRLRLSAPLGQVSFDIGFDQR
jgi:hypothetical protein